MKTNKNSSVNFDYSRIKDKVSENIAEQMPKVKRMPLWKRITLVAAYTLLVCAIACTSTWGIQKAYASTKIVYVDGDGISDIIYNTPAPVHKASKYMEKFDRYISFGRMTSTELMRSYLLSEADKDVINHTVEHFQQELGTDFTGGVFLGEIDGEDYIYIEIDYPFSGYIVNADTVKYNEAVGRIKNCEQCKSIFPNFYKCDLEYSLNDVVQAFEKIIGTNLTDEFLCDAQMTNLNVVSCTAGINMFFIENDDWYGTTPSSSKEVDKYQWDRQTLLYTEKGDYSNAKVVKNDEEGLFVITLDEHDTIYANEIISIGKDGLVYTREHTLLSEYCEVFYALYDNQLYVLNRSYMLTGKMYYSMYDKYSTNK